MPAPANQINSNDIDASLSQEFVRNFNHDADRLMEILGLFDVERRHAGRALFMYEVTGELNDEATDESSSGRAYKEGDLVALSNFKVNKVPIGELKAYPYRKQTTYQAILDDGYEAAVIKTDNRLRSQIRSAQIVDFFEFLQKGTGTASAQRPFSRHSRSRTRRCKTPWRKSTTRRIPTSCISSTAWTPRSTSREPKSPCRASSG